MAFHDAHVAETFAKTPWAFDNENAVQISMNVLRYMSFPFAYFGRKDAHHNV